MICIIPKWVMSAIFISENKNIAVEKPILLIWILLRNRGLMQFLQFILYKEATTSESDEKLNSDFIARKSQWNESNL